MSYLNDEFGNRLNWMRDEQSRINASFEARIKDLESENKDVRNRFTVLTRMMIAKQIASAEEIALALAAMSAPAVVAEPPLSESPPTLPSVNPQP